MKVQQLLEVIQSNNLELKKDGHDNYSIFIGKERIARTTIYKDKYDGQPAINVGYFGIVKKFRNQGFGLKCLQMLPKVLGNPHYVIAEPMSQIIFKLNTKAWGMPIYIADDIRTYTYEEALKELPVEANSDLSGNRLYAVYDLKSLKEYNLSPRQKENALDNKATIIVTMPPEMFLDLTTISKEDPVHGMSGKFSVAGKAKSKEQYQQWMDTGNILVHPFLDIDEKTGKVIRHEGRSRAYAAMQHGDKQYEVAIHISPLSRQLSIKNVPDVWTSQFNPNYKINFKQEVQKGTIKVLNDNVQKQYQKESKLNETQPSAVYKSTIPDVYKALPKLGHGLTSLVLDKGDGNVIMFTRDAVKAEWLTRDWGIKIGETVDVLHGMPHKKMEIRDMPVYVIQMPKLYKLDSKNRAIIKKEVDNWHRVRMNSSGVNAEDRFHNELTNFIDAYPDSVLVPMIEFLSNYGTMANVDVAVRNTLQDKDGNIILVDPIVSSELLKIMYGR